MDARQNITYKLYLQAVEQIDNGLGHAIHGQEGKAIMDIGGHGAEAVHVDGIVGNGLLVGIGIRVKLVQLDVILPCFIFIASAGTDIPAAMVTRS